MSTLCQQWRYGRDRHKANKSVGGSYAVSHEFRLARTYEDRAVWRASIFSKFKLLVCEARAPGTRRGEAQLGGAQWVAG
jgi:hypothetical protein